VPDSLMSPAARPPLAAAMNTVPMTDMTAHAAVSHAEPKLDLHDTTHDTAILDDDRAGLNIDIESLTETLAEPESDPDGQPVATFIPSVLGSKSDPVTPSRPLMAWILLVTFAGLAGPVWAATRLAMKPEDLVSLAFVACVLLNLVFSLVPRFDIQRGKRKVFYSFGEVGTLISIAIASAPVAIVAGFVALTIGSIQEYVDRPQERHRILFNYGLGSLGAWVTVLVATSFQIAPWNYLVATFVGAVVVDCCLAQCFRIAFELPYRTYFARDWWSRLGIPAAVALATGTILMIPHAAVALTAFPLVAIVFWLVTRELLRVRSDRAHWVTLDLHNSALSGLALERDIARNTILNARVLFPMDECALFIYPTAVNKSGGYVVRLQGQGQYKKTEPYEQGLTRSYVPPQMGANAVVSAELAYAPLIAANKVLGHFELRFSSYQRRTGETATVLTHFLGKTSSSMMLARQNERLRSFAESKAREAERDALTGLGNRSRLHRGGVEALRYARQHERRAALIIFDLDGFKRINDTLGHATGDQMLQVIADRIKSAIGPHDVAARIGGDEFVILAADLAARDDAVEYAEAISRLIAELIPVDGITLAVEASAGVAHVEGDINVAELLKRADIALYAAKDHGRGVTEVYHPRLAHHTPEQLQLAADLRTCLEREELVLHYQPQVNLSDGRFMGMEALVRWQHPDRGLLYPDTFVPLAEQSGMVRPFTLLILDRALSEFSRLRAVANTIVDPALSGWVGEEFSLSVNFSARNLLDLELPEHVRERLAHYEVPANRLTIEITESANVHDWASAERVMKVLSELGCRVSIDDFGTGFSSLHSLVQRQGTVSEVKIDRSFVGALVNGSGSEFALVQAIVSMAHGTGCQVVAEGVELAESVPVLRAMGCDIAQGYYFARPMPMSEVLPWFESWPQAWALVAPAETGRSPDRLARIGAGDRQDLPA